MAEYIEREAIKFETWTTWPLHEQITVVRKKTIDSIPAADVALVRHGRWEKEVYVDPQGGEWTKYRCSLCGKIEVLKEPYCNCGAKMDQEEQDG